ncbi:MAG TPA: hypothetical protein VHX88_18150 [Solirubrobacteraceae bacterium]|jgi:hypothetical protein|nr:hypothetical protein [Solirubrobacteraceae bacterium]
MSYENAFDLWQQGERRFRAAAPEQRAVLDRVIARIVAELRRRLGSRFETDELVELYGKGTSWCLQIAVDAAPDAPWAWDTGVVADAAFGRYLRQAADFAGGRREERERE